MNDSTQCWIDQDGAVACSSSSPQQGFIAPPITANRAYSTASPSGSQTMDPYSFNPTEYVARIAQPTPPRLRDRVATPASACFDVSTGRFVGGSLDGVVAPAGTWGVSPDGATVSVNISGDTTQQLPACKTDTPGTRMPPPDCCVHVLTDTLARISRGAPARGKTDCPEHPRYHEVDVQVLQVSDDGKGGMTAIIIAPFNKRPTAWPVCTVGTQDGDPVECCLVGARGDLRVQCRDKRSPLNGLTPERAVAAGYTLELCLPPAEIPPCCVELVASTGARGGGRGRLVCDDLRHELHGKMVEAVSSDGMSAVVRLQVRDNTYEVELPLCAPEDVPEEVPCCIKDGQLYCPDFPEWHGMRYSEYRKIGRGSRTPCFDPTTNRVVGGPLDGQSPPSGLSYSEDGTRVTIFGLTPSGRSPDVTLPVCSSAELKDCPEVRPPPPIPECCVQETERSVIILCNDTTSPWHGYELQPGEYNCFDAPQGRVCEVVTVAARPTGPCFDTQTGRFVGGPYDGTQAPAGTWTVSAEGVVSVNIAGDNRLELPACPGPNTLRFPVCPPLIPPPPPPDCCYDVATGELICVGSPGHEWNGVTTPLIDLISKDGRTIAVVQHPSDPGQLLRLPICEDETPPECCFRPAEDARRKMGSIGTLVCPSAPSLDGLEATLVDINVMPDGSVIATVSWPGGGGRVPICCPLPEDCPGCPPPYFCCVRLETRTFVCPANTGMHGQPAEIVGVEDVDGMPFARLQDGSLLPACGQECPPPRACPPCIPEPPGPPGPPLEPPGNGCEPGDPPWGIRPPTRRVGRIPPGDVPCPPNGPQAPWGTRPPERRPGNIPEGDAPCKPNGPQPPWGERPAVGRTEHVPAGDAPCKPNGPQPPWGERPQASRTEFIPPDPGPCPPGDPRSR